MTAKMIYEKFKTVFSYLNAQINVVSYKEIIGDKNSILIKMFDGTSYIFTYLPNGKYSLTLDKLGSGVRKERDDAKEL